MEYKDAGIEVYSSYEEMLGHPELNAVWVSTSTDVHGRQTMAGIEKGLHVLCEKPLSNDMEEVRREPIVAWKCTLNNFLLVRSDNRWKSTLAHADKSDRRNESSMSPLDIPS